MKMLLLNVVMMLRFTTPPKRIILSIEERKRRKLARSRGCRVNGGTNSHRVYSFDENRNVSEECRVMDIMDIFFPQTLTSLSPSYETEYAYSISITISVIIICRFGV